MDSNELFQKLNLIYNDKSSVKEIFITSPEFGTMMRISTYRTDFQLLKKWKKHSDYVKVCIVFKCDDGYPFVCIEGDGRTKKVSLIQKLIHFFIPINTEKNVIQYVYDFRGNKKCSDECFKKLTDAILQCSLNGNFSNPKVGKYGKALMEYYFIN